MRLNQSRISPCIIVTAADQLVDSHGLLGCLERTDVMERSTPFRNVPAPRNVPKWNVRSMGRNSLIEIFYAGSTKPADGSSSPLVLSENPLSQLDSVSVNVKKCVNLRKFTSKYDDLITASPTAPEVTSIRNMVTLRSLS